MGQAQSINTYLQKGLIFPLVIEEGKVVLSEYTDLIKASIIYLLTSQWGTRLFQPLLGSRTYQLVGLPNDNYLINLAKVFIIDVLLAEQRIELLEVTLTRPSETKLSIYLRYNIKITFQVNELSLELAL